MEEGIMVLGRGSQTTSTDPDTGAWGAHVYERHASEYKIPRLSSCIRTEPLFMGHSRLPTEECPPPARRHRIGLADTAYGLDLLKACAPFHVRGHAALAPMLRRKGLGPHD